VVSGELLNGVQAAGFRICAINVTNFNLLPDPSPPPPTESPNANPTQYSSRQSSRKPLPRSVGPAVAVKSWWIWQGDTMAAVPEAVDGGISMVAGRVCAVCVCGGGGPADLQSRDSVRFYNAPRALLVVASAHFLFYTQLISCSTHSVLVADHSVFITNSADHHLTLLVADHSVLVADHSVVLITISIAVPVSIVFTALAITALWWYKGQVSRSKVIPSQSALFVLNKAPSVHATPKHLAGQHVAAFELSVLHELYQSSRRCVEVAAKSTKAHRRWDDRGGPWADGDGEPHTARLFQRVALVIHLHFPS